jgi:hypothetical protein
MKIDYIYSNNEVYFYSNIDISNFKPVLFFKYGSIKFLNIFPGTKYYLNDITSNELRIHNNISPTLATIFKNVYNMKDIYLHSSISNNPYGFVCNAGSNCHKNINIFQ